MPKLSPLQTTAFLVAIVLFGLFLRVTALSSSAVKDPVRGDAISYFFYAVNLKTEGVYSRTTPTLFNEASQPKADATIPPGYPLFVTAFLGEEWKQGTNTGVYASIEPVLIAQTLLSVTVILLVFFTGRRLFGPVAALGAALLAAISPHLVNINIYLLTESLFTVFFCLGLWLLVRHLSPEAPWSGALAGLALAGAALTRSTVQYLPLVLAAFFILRSPSSWRGWAGFLTAFLVVFCAWGFRNVASVGSFSDPWAMTATIQHGSYPEFMHAGLPESQGIPYHYDTELSSHMPLADLLAAISRRFLADPGSYLHWYLIGKPLALFNWNIMPIGSEEAVHLLLSGDIYIYPTPATPYGSHPLFIATYLICKVLYLPCLLLAVAGAVLTWIPALRHLWGSRLIPMQLLSLTFFYVVGIHMVGAPFPRYAIPFQPLLYLLALGSLSLASSYWRTRGTTATIEAPGPVL